MAFGTFEVLTGDFAKGAHHQCVSGNLLMKNDGRFLRETIPLSEIVEIRKEMEGTGGSFGGAVGLGLVGGLVLGPLGAAAGLLKGGVTTYITFICSLKDGRTFIASAKRKVFEEISAAYTLERYRPTPSETTVKQSFRAAIPPPPPSLPYDRAIAAIPPPPPLPPSDRAIVAGPSPLMTYVNENYMFICACIIAFSVALLFAAGVNTSINTRPMTDAELISRVPDLCQVTSFDVRPSEKAREFVMIAGVNLRLIDRCRHVLFVYRDGTADYHAILSPSPTTRPESLDLAMKLALF